MTAMPPDKITLMLGHIPAAEHEQRRRIGVLRDAAALRVWQTDNSTARFLAQIAARKANEWIWAPSDAETLAEAVQFLRRLMVLVDQLEALEPTEGGDRAAG